MGGAPFTLVLGFDGILGTSTTITPATGTDGTVSSYVVWENNISATYTPGTVSKLQTLNITVYSSDNTAHNAQTFQTIVTYPQWTMGYNMTITTTTNTNDTLALVSPNSWAYCIDNLSPKTYWEFSVVSCTNYDNNTYVEFGVIDKTQLSRFATGLSDSTTPYIKHIWTMDANGVYQGNDIFTGYRFTQYVTSPLPPSILPAGSIIGIGYNFTNNTTSFYLYESGTLTYSFVEDANTFNAPNVTNYIPFVGVSDPGSAANIQIQMIIRHTRPADTAPCFGFFSHACK